MLNLKINNTTVLMTKFFSAEDAQGCLEAVKGFSRVVFIDTPVTPHLQGVIETLVATDIEVIIRDHHNIIDPKNTRQQEIADAVSAVQTVLGDDVANCKFETRDAHPACSSLVTLGEFAQEGTIIVADPDPDGLLASMKALGIEYLELETDAKTLDGPRYSATEETLSPLGFSLLGGFSDLPNFRNNPQRAQAAKQKLFEQFVKAVTGDETALAQLNQGKISYQKKLKEAEVLAESATEVSTGIFLVDVRKADRFDPGHLDRLLEKQGAKVTVFIKSRGKIADIFGSQYTVSVLPKFQKEISLTAIITKSDPEKGMICNIDKMANISESVWGKIVLPALILYLEKPRLMNLDTRPDDQGKWSLVSCCGKTIGMVGVRNSENETQYSYAESISMFFCSHCEKIKTIQESLV